MRVWHNENAAMEDGGTRPEGTWEKRIYDEDELRNSELMTCLVMGM